MPIRPYNGIEVDRPLLTESARLYEHLPGKVLPAPFGVGVQAVTPLPCDTPGQRPECNGAC